MNDVKHKASSEIEQALLKDSAGIYRDNLLDQFNREHLQIIQVMNRGVKPDEYQVLSGLLKAIEEAIVIVNKMWTNYQRTRRSS
jgi:type III secretion system YseE family protein